MVRTRSDLQLLTNRKADHLMAYVFKNGMRYLAEDTIKEGYHYHSDISVKVGTNVVRTLKLQILKRHRAGELIPFKVSMQKVHLVKLNGQILQHKIDYVIENENSAVAFTFNLITNDKIEIEGIV